MTTIIMSNCEEVRLVSSFVPVKYIYLSGDKLKAQENMFSI